MCIVGDIIFIHFLITIVAKWTKASIGHGSLVTSILRETMNLAHEHTTRSQAVGFSKRTKPNIALFCTHRTTNLTTTNRTLNKKKEY